MNQGILRISGLDDVEQKVEASYTSKNEYLYILYQENLEGMEGTSSRIKCKEGYLELERKGKNTLSLVFEQGKEYFCHYPTPFGILDIEISTNNVHVEETGSSVKVLVEYDILGEEKTSRQLCVFLER